MADSEQKLQIDPRAVRVMMAARDMKRLEDLANAAHMTPLTLRRLLNGENFKVSSLEDLAKALGCNPLDLLRVEGYPAPHLAAPAISATT